MAEETLTPLAKAEFPVALAEMNVTAAANINLVIDYIADQCLCPGQPGSKWAGKDDAISWIAGHAKLELTEAVEVVRAAEESLWSQTSEDDAHVQRMLALARLRIIRRMLQDQMSKDQVEMRWIYEDTGKIDENGKKLFDKLPLREKVNKGLNPQLVRLSLMVEELMSQLMVRKSADNAASVKAILEHMITSTEEGGETKVVQTQSRKVRAMVTDSSPKTKELLASIEPAKRPKK